MCSPFALADPGANPHVIKTPQALRMKNAQIAVRSTENKIKLNTVQKSHYLPGNHMLATSKNVLFPGHNHLLTTGTDDLTL